MIHLYTWPTPNGHKVQIMLEEVGLPYMVHPVDIIRGAQFDPNYLALNPNNKVPTIVDEDGPGRQAAHGLRDGRDPRLSRRKDRTAHAVGAAGALRGDAMAHVADGRAWSDARPGAALPPLRHREGALCDRALYQGRPAPVVRDGAAARRARLPRRRLLHRRHRLLSLGSHPQDGEPEPR